MNQGVDLASSLHSGLAGQAEENRRRIAEFQRLSADERLREITKLMEFGMKMVLHSSRRSEIERLWAEEEAKWKRLQQELSARHGA